VAQMGTSINIIDWGCDIKGHGHFSILYDLIDCGFDFHTAF